MLCANCGIEFQGNFCSNCGAFGNGDNTDAASEPIPRLKEPYFVKFGSQMFDANSIIRMYGFGIRKYGAYAFISQKTGLPVQIVKSQLDPIIRHHIDAKESTNIFDGAKAQIKMGNSDAETGNSDAKLEVNGQAKEKPLSKHQRILEEAVEINDCPEYHPPKKEDIPSFKQWKQEQVRHTEPQCKPVYQPEYKQDVAKTVVVEREAEHKLSKRDLKRQAHNSGQACCPKCGSVSLSANKKGFGFVKGAIGGGLGALVAPVGIVAGLGAGNIGGKRLWVTCLNCGKRWKM